MEALGSLAVLISFGSVIVGIAVVIAFFIMASNVSDIAKKLHDTQHTQTLIKLALDKAIRLMEERAEQKI